MGLDAIVKRERLVSIGIKGVLRLVIFLAVFGIGKPALTFSAPDGFAFDFLPQGAIIALMATLVPALITRRTLRKAGQNTPATRALIAQAARIVVVGTASAALLMAMSLLGSCNAIPWCAALVGKLPYMVAHLASLQPIEP